MFRSTIFLRQFRKIWNSVALHQLFIVFGTTIDSIRTEFVKHYQWASNNHKSRFSNENMLKRNFQ